MFFQIARDSQNRNAGFPRERQGRRKAASGDGGLRYKKLQRRPAVCLISQIAHKHLCTVARSERALHALLLTWPWVLEPFTDTRNCSTKGCPSLGYFASVLLVGVPNRAPHFCFKIPNKGDISHIEILNSSGKKSLWEDKS